MSSKNDKKKNKKNENGINLTLNKKTLYIIIGSIVVVLLAVVLILNRNKIFNSNGIFNNSDKSIKIVASANKSVTYEKYENEYVSINIPKGWKVEEYKDYYAYYVLRAYDPNNEDYQIFFNLKTDGFTKSAKAKDYYAKRTPKATQANLPVLSPATTEHYFELFSDIHDAVLKINNGVSYYPKLDNFKSVEKLGTINVGGDILRGTYNGVNGNAEGIFTATVKEMDAIYLGSIDVSYYLVYYTAFITTPENELVNWENVLLNSLSSLEFTEKFQTGFYKELNKNSKTFSFNMKQSQEITNGIMDSWEKRQKSLDIQSQKRSDATLGYERVYDTETGEVYKAYNGFTDSYSGNRYKPIDDSQYAKSISGYIER